MRRLFLAACLLPACAITSDGGEPPESRVVPGEAWIDFGIVLDRCEGEAIRKEFTLVSQGRVDVVAQVRVTGTSTDFTITPTAAVLRPGEPVHFTVDLHPTPPAGERFLDLVILTPNATPSEVLVHLRATTAIASFQGEGCTDFGTVLLGDERVQAVELQNPCGAPTTVRLTSEYAAFTPLQDAVEIPAGGTASVDVRFSPPARGHYQGDLLLQICEDCATIRRCLTGTAAIEDFEVEGAPVDFGEQPAGTTACRDMEVRNTGDVELAIREATLDDALLRVPGAFTLSLDDLLDVPLAPGGAAPLQLCFTPPDPGQAFSGRLTLSSERATHDVDVAGAAAP